MQVHQNIFGTRLLQQTVDRFKGVGAVVHCHLSLQIDDTQLPAQAVQHKHSAAGHTGVVVCRSKDSLFFLKQRIDLPSFEDMVAGGDDICARIEQHLRAFRRDSVALGGIFSVDDTGVDGIQLL